MRNKRDRKRDTRTRNENFVPALKPVRDDVLGIWATLKDLATETEKAA